MNCLDSMRKGRERSLGRLGGENGFEHSFVLVYKIRVSSFLYNVGF